MVAYVVLVNFTDQGVRNAKESQSSGPKPSRSWQRRSEWPFREIVWTQGRYDVVTIVDAPDESSFMSLDAEPGLRSAMSAPNCCGPSPQAEMTKIVGNML